jgi:hypothetical protein
MELQNKQMGDEEVLVQFNTIDFQHVDEEDHDHFQEGIKTSKDAFMVIAALLYEPLPVLFSTSHDRPYNASTVGDLATENETAVCILEEDTSRLLREG